MTRAQSPEVRAKQDKWIIEVEQSGPWFFAGVTDGDGNRPGCYLWTCINCGNAIAANGMELHETWHEQERR